MLRGESSGIYLQNIWKEPVLAVLMSWLDWEQL